MALITAFKKAVTWELMVQVTPELEAQEKILRAAIDLLHKSKTAKKMMRRAALGGYKISFDSKRLAKNNLGECRRKTKEILLRPQKDPRKLALTLAHELVHASQFIKGRVVCHSGITHPVSTLHIYKTMEADALAHELLVAVELSRAGVPNIAQKLYQKKKDALLLKIFQRAEKENLADDKILAAGFKIFHADRELNFAYESMVISSLADSPDETLQNPTQVNQHICPEKLRQQFDRHAGGYLKRNAHHLNLADDVYKSVHPKTQKALTALEKLRRQNPATHNDAPWQAPVYGTPKRAKNALSSKH